MDGVGLSRSLRIGVLSWSLILSISFFFEAEELNFVEQNDGSRLFNRSIYLHLYVASEISMIGALKSRTHFFRLDLMRIE